MTGNREAVRKLDRLCKTALTDRDGLTRLRARQEIGNVLDIAEDEAVDLARAQGRTWQEIGDALGITRQTAHQRFSK